MSGNLFSCQMMNGWFRVQKSWSLSCSELFIFIILPLLQ